MRSQRQVCECHREYRRFVKRAGQRVPDQRRQALLAADPRLYFYVGPVGTRPERTAPPWLALLKIGGC